jgi:amino acid transporter
MNASFSQSVEMNAEPTRLRRTLGLTDLVAYGLAYIALIAPLSTLGFVWDASGGLIALSYVLGACCMYFTAKSYAMMGEIVPQAGSVYGYARHSLGALPGFIAGWLILLDYLLVPALVFTLMAVGMQTLIPWIDRASWIVILTGAAFAINWFGVSLTTRVSLASVIAQGFVIAGVIGLAIYALYNGKGTGGLTLEPIYSAAAFDPEKIFAATSICILSFLGFDAIATLTEEVRGDHRRLVGRAIMIVLLICAVVFFLTTWVLGNLMKGVEIHDPASAIFELLAVQVGPWSAVALAWLLAIAVGFANALPMQVGVARILFAMGRDRQLPTFFAHLHRTRQTPNIAMGVATAISLVMALAMRDRIDTLASFVNFGALSGFLMLHLSVLVRLGIRNPERRLLPHVVAPMLGIIIVLAVLSGMQRDALEIGFVWLAIGLACGFWLRAKVRRQPDI